MACRVYLFLGGPLEGNYCEVDFIEELKQPRLMVVHKEFPKLVLATGEKQDGVEHIYTSKLFYLSDEHDDSMDGDKRERTSTYVYIHSSLTIPEAFYNLINNYVPPEEDEDGPPAGPAEPTYG